MSIEHMYNQAVITQCNDTPGNLYLATQTTYNKKRFLVMTNHTRANTRKVLGAAMFYDTDKHRYTYGKDNPCNDRFKKKNG